MLLNTPVRKGWQEIDDMIIGTALIVLSWTLFPYLGWFLWVSIICTVIGAILEIFGLLFFVYFFNIDMKMTAFLEKKLEKVYDKKKRNRKI